MLAEHNEPQEQDFRVVDSEKKPRGRPPTAASARIHITLPEELAERVLEIQRETFASSLTEVIRNALVVYAALLEEHKDGRDVYTQDKDGSDKSRMKIFL